MDFVHMKTFSAYIEAQRGIIRARTHTLSLNVLFHWCHFTYHEVAKAFNRD